MADFTIKAEKYQKDLIPFWGNHFLNGNGYFGIRGTLEEYRKEHMPCINMAGIYDQVGDAWRESVNAPNPLYTYIVVDGVKYTLPEAEPFAHTQALDFYQGIHTRETVWQTPKGKVTVTCERFASMANQHAIGMKYSLSSDFDGKAEIYTGIDGDVWDINGPHFVSVDLSEKDGALSVIGTTGEKGITVETTEAISADFEAISEIWKDEKTLLHHLSFDLEKGKVYTVQKCALVASSVDDNPCKDEVESLSYESLKDESVKAWEKIWELSKVEIDGDEEAMHALNYSIYHLNCIAPRNLKGKSIPARGLSGQVYKGAVFWDTEMFMIDYYIHTDPAVAKTLLEYRIDTIDGARTKAKEYGLNGAYYAWESQEGGFEACSDFNVVDVFTKRPMRTHFRDKQYHVSAAVVYAFMKYIDATGDYSILTEGGLETIIECARMYRSLLLKKADSDFYEIHDVVGPDEYHERVNNNIYTNKMAKFTFETAANLIDYAKANYKDCYEKLDSTYDLGKLSAVFADSAEHIFIREPNEEQVIEQFDGYFSLEDASVAEVRSRLLDEKEYWGGAYGVASQTKVIKQADAVAMLSMFKNDYSQEVMKKNWEYYEPRTEHGSSLSACMYSLLSCYIGNPEAAYPLFIKSAKADLLPGGKEWAGLIYIGGTHPASEGGAWIVAVKGFAGIEIKDGKLTATPSMPKHWKGMRFKLLVHGKVYQVNINEQNEAQIEVL